MTEQTLEQALHLTRAEDGVLTADLTGDFSNGMQMNPPEKGSPFGGLVAALAAKGMIDGLETRSPLRTLTVQFAAVARFGRPLEIRPKLLRGGRRVAYASAELGQAERLTAHAIGTFGPDSETTTIQPLRARPPSRESLKADEFSGPRTPWFTRHVDYVYDGGPHIDGGNIGREPIERLWMRTRDGLPLDAVRLAFLLDAVYPPAWTVVTPVPPMTSVDLRYDFLTDPTPDLCPDGWAFFEFRMLDIDKGWSMDDCIAWAPDGTPLALARQRRKLL